MHEEHVRNNAVKQRLKHQYADIIEEKSDLESAAATVASAPSAPSITVPGDCDHHWQDDLDMLGSSPMASREHEGTSTADSDHSPTQSHGIRKIA